MDQSVAEHHAFSQPGADAPRRMMAALQAVQLAERLFQIESGNDTARLFDLTQRDRARYADAAAVALALLDAERQPPALYVAANRLVDIGSQTPAQRRGLVQMVGQAVERYLDVLAGHHQRVVDQLAPLVAIDREAVDPEGVF